MSTPVETTTAAPEAFMSMLGHLKVSVEQEGIKLYHEAGQWLDHLSWTQVEHLLVPAIRAVAPGVVATVGAVAGEVSAVAGDIAAAAGRDAPTGTDQKFSTLPTDVLDELRTMFGQWFGAELNKFRAEIGHELDMVRQQIPAPASSSPDSGSDSSGPSAVDPVVPAGEPDTTADSAATP